MVDLGNLANTPSSILFAALIFSVFTTLVFLMKREPLHVLSPWVNLALLFSGLYVFDFVRLPPQYLSLFYINFAFDKLFFVAFLAMCAYLCSFFTSYAKRKNSFRIRAQNLDTNFFRPLIFLIGIGARFAFIAYSGGNLNFYSAAHGSAGNYEQTTAYSYKLRELMYIGFPICAYAVLSHKAKKLTSLCFVFGVVFFVRSPCVRR